MTARTAKLRTGVALSRNFALARVHPRYWRGSTQLAREAIGRHQATQKLAELAPLLAILASRRPMRIVEIGTFRGGTLWAWCKVAAVDALIVSVDLPGGPFGGGGYEPTELRAFAHERQTLTLVQADSHAADTLGVVERAVAGPVDFLFVDGDHTYDGVSSDYSMYSPLVANDGLIAFHDIVPGRPEHTGDVPRFWRELASSRKREIVDNVGSGGSDIRGYGIGLIDCRHARR